MASRLERLFVLLESGSSSVTRGAAAQQLGEVQKQKPHELHRLLGRVYVLLRSQAWETRIAAGQAFETILKHVPQWNPPPSCVKREGNAEASFETGRLKFDDFDIEKVLNQGAHLMASEGKEYDFEEASISSQDLREKLVRQRQLLNARLGLDVASKLGMDMTDVFSNDDLMCSSSETKPNFEQKVDIKKHISELIPSGVQLSSREMNRAKRKARQQKSIIHDDALVKDEPDKKKFKFDSVRIDDNIPILGEWVPELDGIWGPEVEWWPLEGWASALSADLFSVQWETRHGAATALRELLKSQGSGAGKERGTTEAEMEQMHQLWLEDICLRLLCVLAFDRFGDFVSDQVIAPVRETCAQCLGVIVPLIGSNSINHIASNLTILANQSHWEARHGALLGLKYLLAVQQELKQDINVFPAVVRALWDPVEDVAAAAARALTPVTGSLIDRLPMIVPFTFARLHSLLLVNDELAAACGSYMTLLATLLAEPKIINILSPRCMSSVIPHLWPYLSHPTSSVRRSALQTIQTLTKCLGSTFSVDETVNNEKPLKTEVPENVQISESAEIKCDKTKYVKELLSIEVEELDNFDKEDIQWNASLLQDALRHIFQRVMVEHVADIKNMVEEVWTNLLKVSNLEQLLHAACPYISTWICLIMQPAKVPFDPIIMIKSKPVALEKKIPANSHNSDLGDDLLQTNLNLCQKWYIGGSESTSVIIRESNVIITRCMASRMIGMLSCYIIKPAPGIPYNEVESPMNCYVKVLLFHLSSKSYLHRLIIGLIIIYWARLDPSVKPCPPELSSQLHQCLTQPIYFDEIAISCSKILQDTRDFVAMMQHYKVPIEGDEYKNITSLEQTIQITGHFSEELISKVKLKPKVHNLLEEQRKNILSSAIECSNEQNSYNISTLAALAGACANLNAFPDKLNPIIKPLMESIKREDNEQLQQIAADNLAILLNYCVDRNPCPNVKVLNNLCAFLKSDVDYTYRILNGESCNNLIDNNLGILTLTLQQRQTERMASKRTNPSNSNVPSRGPGRPPHTDIPIDELFPVEDEVYKLNRIQKRGASSALISITSLFGDELPTKLPSLWELIMKPFKDDSYKNDNMSITKAEDLISSLQVLEVILPHFHKSLLPQIFEGIDRLALLLENVYRVVRHMAAKCIAVLAHIEAPLVMQVIVKKVIPLLGTVESDIKRQGAAEVLACIIDKLQINIVPYSVLMIVPLLGRMSDHDECVRLMCTHCFATLIQLMPLDGVIKENLALPEELQNQREKDHLFLQQLFNPKTIGDYKIPMAISTDLRSYQQAGVNWLAFLNKYKLHGILCDDMGLGKTLQSICMIAGDHYSREKQYKKNKSPDCAPLPSLVICPPTLTGHWVYEVDKFLPNKYLKPLHYIGPPSERDRLKCSVKSHNLIIASYDIVRKDIDFFSNIKWNYCVLDEGHIVKNGKTKVSKAIKMLAANHRLILSGTPIQNNVLELWSLFDFLMPGLLGTERQFTARYSRPILAARDPRATPQHQVAGALAMEALHRQVLPFLLRRIKEDVLKELPPKITQDYYCELSPLQKRLYEDFSRVHIPNGLDDNMENQQHIFQALRYLQNVCNHPKLVLNSTHPEYGNISNELSRQNTSLNDIQHSAKLPALRQLLLDCGIGCNSNETSVLSQHRALIFCHLKGMLEVVENDLLRPLMPQVSYLRLDGSVPPGQRQSVVQRFNNDPSIDVLLLTTQVGGLGLNLTGADTIIFVEHDWNPMKDLQAMDRAHRIGQKKVVNVYRLITRGTLEEKIMSLQKFKLLTANTVISSENASMETMGTDKLLDIFSNNGDAKSQGISSTSRDPSKGPVNMKTILENLPDLWDDREYENEYDMSNFVQNLLKK